MRIMAGFMTSAILTLTLTLTIILTPTLITVGAFASDYPIRGNVHELADGSFSWTADEFPGFYYDVDDGTGTERLSLNVTGLSVAPGEAEYVTRPQEKAFQHRQWGDYRVVAFLGNLYFAGYAKTPITSTWSCLDRGLGEVLIDRNDRITISGDDHLTLEEGYYLELDDGEDGVVATLFKEGEAVGSANITPPGDYVYKAPGDGDEPIPLIAVHVDGNVKLETTSYYTIRGIFQISERFEPLMEGYGSMRLRPGVDELALANRDGLDLSQDTDLAGGIGIGVSGSEEVGYRIFLYSNRSDPDLGQRGEVQRASEGALCGWSPTNFPGFYYDLREALGDELLEMDVSSNGLVEPYGLRYSTSTQEREFGLEDWGYYHALGFLGKKYFAGYSDRMPVVDGEEIDPALYLATADDNLLLDGQLTELLIDRGETVRVNSGEMIDLDEGFAATITPDGSCQKVFVELYRNGEMTDQDYFKVPGTYAYTEDLGQSRQVVVLALHVSDVNCTEDGYTTLDGIFQISDEPRSLKVNEEFGLMKISSISYDGITMVNRDKSVSLGVNKTVHLLPEISLKTADQMVTDVDPLRIYIFKPPADLNSTKW